MKEKQQLQVDPDKLKLNQDSAFFIYQAANWSRFLAIMGFIFIGLLLIMGIFVAATGSMMGGMMGGMMSGMGYAPYSNIDNMGGAMFGTIYLVIIIISCAISVIPIIYLMQFANKAKKGLFDNDSEGLAQGLRSLKNYFVFNGVMVIISLALIVFSLLISIPMALMM